MPDPIRALIVDDEPLARRLIHALLASDADVQIVGECSSGAQALAALNKVKPDLVFLDVQMPGLSGFDVVGALDPAEAPCIIFVTAYDAYAIRAFEVHALDYLLKPVEKDRFESCLARAKTLIREKGLADLTEKLLSLSQAHTGSPVASTRADSGGPHDTASGRGGGPHDTTSGQGGGPHDTASGRGGDPHDANRGKGDDQEGRPPQASDNRGRCLTVRCGDRVVGVRLDDIVWVEAANQYVKLHTSDAEHLLSRSMRSLAKELDPQKFVRIHRSAIVNVSFIEEIRTAKNGVHMLLLTTGKKLSLSRSRRSELSKLMT